MTAPTPPEDGFREIQLNGKQLVFLFMATTIVAVVIFLCGVMVGRGVRGSAVPAATEASAVPPAADLNAVPDAQAPAKTAAAAAQAATPPPPPPDDLGSEPRPDIAKAGEQAAAPPPATTERPDGPGGKAAAQRAPANTPVEKSAAVVATQKPAAPVAQAPAATPGASGGPADVPAEPGRDGIPVQVGAYAERGEAERVARGLLSKGYPAYIVRPTASGGVFRVRVGNFKERRQAEAVVRRLIKEEQLNPWIPRR